MAARSKAYPSIDLGTAVARIEALNRNLGSEGQYEREKLAIGMGYKSLSGASARAIGALVHYGLLRRDGDKYGLSEVAHGILYPHRDGERMASIRNALMQPGLFADITTLYEGKELPALLGNILTSAQFGISPKVKDDVVAIYRASLEYAGLLYGNQVKAGLGSNGQDDTAAEPAEVPQPNVSAAPATIAQEPGPGEQAKGDSGSVQRFELLMHDGTKAALAVPYGLSETDRNKLKSAIDLFN